MSGSWPGDCIHSRTPANPRLNADAADSLDAGARALGLAQALALPLQRRHNLESETRTSIRPSAARRSSNARAFAAVEGERVQWWFTTFYVWRRRLRWH